MGTVLSTAFHQNTPGGIRVVRLEGVREGLHGHLQFRQQLEVLIGGTAEGGEVVADDHCVDAAQQAFPGAEFAEGDLAPAGEP